MPLGDLEAMLDAMEPIRAQERLDYISDTMVSTGNTKRGAPTRHVRKLERMTAGQRAPVEGELQQIGIEVARG